MILTPKVQIAEGLTYIKLCKYVTIIYYHIQISNQQHKFKNETQATLGYD